MFSLIARYNRLFCSKVFIACKCRAGAPTIASMDRRRRSPNPHQHNQRSADMPAQPPPTHTHTHTPRNHTATTTTIANGAPLAHPPLCLDRTPPHPNLPPRPHQHQSMCLLTTHTCAHRPSAHLFPPGPFPPHAPILTRASTTPVHAHRNRNHDGHDDDDEQPTTTPRHNHDHQDQAMAITLQRQTFRNRNTTPHRTVSLPTTTIRKDPKTQSARTPQQCNAPYNATSYPAAQRQAMPCDGKPTRHHTMLDPAPTFRPDPVRHQANMPDLPGQPASRTSARQLPSQTESTTPGLTTAMPLFFPLPAAQYIPRASSPNLGPIYRTSRICPLRSLFRATASLLHTMDQVATAVLRPGPMTTAVKNEEATTKARCKTFYACGVTWTGRWVLAYRHTASQPALCRVPDTGTTSACAHAINRVR